MDVLRPEPRKIAVVVPKYGLVGGGERFASELAERLARNEYFEIHVFANRWVVQSSRICFHRIPNIRFPRFMRPLFFAWLVQRKLDRMNFDVVHSHQRIFHADIFSMHGVPHAGWVRDVRKKKRPSLYDRAEIYIERFLMRRGTSSLFLPVSSLAMEAFRREYHTLPGEWQIIHPGVDVARFSSPDQNDCRAEIRERYGIGEDDLLLLFVGMNFEVKGLDTIVAALAKAQPLVEGTKIRLLVVGRGNERKYREQAQALGIGDSVIFAGTHSAGVELEAMAAGLPVIVSPNVGAKDLVVHGTNGYILSVPDDVEGAARHIVRLTETGMRGEMGVAAAHTAADHDWDRLAQKIAGLYRKVSVSRVRGT